MLAVGCSLVLSMFSGNKPSLDPLAPKGVPSTSHDLARPSPEEVEKTTQHTKEALALLLSGKKSAKASSLPSSAPSTQYLQYSNPDSPKMIKMVKHAVDPLAPPKFKAKKLPRGPGSPPAPILHSPPRKIGKEEQASWKIPPCVSNWKNPKGFTISLDKRMLSDGKSLQPVCVNDNFSKLSEALYVADQYAREELDKRAALQRKQAEEERESKEEYLRMLARKAREEQTQRNETFSIGDRNEHANSRQASHNFLEHRRPPKEVESSNNNKPFTREVLYDQRLFNQNAGIESGFGNDDEYNLYDKPLFKVKPTTYLPGKEDVEQKSRGNAPVQFEKETSTLPNDDPFGVESFLSAARKGKQTQ